MSDTLHRFIFDNANIRGEIVKLNHSCEIMLQGHNYPPIIAELLQQAAAVNALLATTLKFEGRISLQLQAQNNLKMLVVQTTHELEYRGLARYNKDADYSAEDYSSLTQNGQLSITIEPKKGKRYQGIVPLTGNNLAECIEEYFKQSEQLQTRIWLFNDKQHYDRQTNNKGRVFGFLLQALPNMQNEDDFQHLVFLASTLKREESLNTDSETIIHRLFHQETIKGLSVQSVNFNCTCSEKKMLNSLSLLPEEEINETLQQDGSISVMCEFCLNQFSFNEMDIKSNFSVRGNDTKH